MSPPSPSIVAVTVEPDPDPPPLLKSTSSPGFLWKNLFSDVDSTNFPSSSPSYLPDGTPVVLAPKSVILQASSTWAGHLLCRFLGEPPSPAKFFSDLNRIWGKHGDISVRRFSSGTFLVFVPSSSTRKWILQTGLWSSGTVSFVVSEWSVNPSLATPPKLTSATTVLTIRGIPPQLWSHEAVARIAGGVAKLIPGTRASLPLSSLGTATIRAIVPLGSPLPPSVLVKDDYGESVLVSVEYGRLPHLCSSCNSYGHQKHRCPLRHSDVIPNSSKSTSNLGMNSESELAPILDPIPEVHRETMDVDCDTTPLNPPMIKSRPQVHVIVAQGMDLDNQVCEELVLKPTSETHPAPVSSSPSTDSIQQVPETVTQVLVVENQACEELPSKCTSVPHLALVSNTHRTEVLHQVTSSTSPPQVDPSLMQDVPCPSTPPFTSPESRTLPPTSTESLAENKELPYSCNDHSSNLITNPEPIPASFSFPPLVAHSLDQKSDPHSPLSLSETLPLIQHSQETLNATSKKVGNRFKSHGKSDSASYLGCKVASFQFKPRGIVEKRRKKAQNDLIPEAEDLQQCFQELNSDKKDTTYYEAIRAHKLLVSPESVTEEVLET